MSRGVGRSIVEALLAGSGGRMAALAAWLLLAGAGALLWMVALRGVWPILDVAAPLSLHALALALIAGATLALRRGRLVFLASSLGVLALAPSLLTLDARERPGVIGRTVLRPETGIGRLSSEGRPVLRVLAINTFRGNSSLDELTRYVARADAEVVVLSEFGPEKQVLLDRLKRAYPYQVSCAHAWPCAQVLLSRERFDRSGTVMPSPTSPPLVWAEFRIGGVSGAKVTVLGTHIYRPSRHYGWHRDQLAGLARRIRGLDGSVIVAGDFNMTRLTHSYADFLAESGLVAGDRELASWPAWPAPMPLPQFQIDHLFVSGELAVVDQRVGVPVGSDHLPLWSAVRMPTRATIMARRPQTTDDAETLR